MSLNGRLKDSELSPTQIRKGGRLTKRAALAADKMALAFALDRGEWLTATDTYRDYDEQVDVRARKGKWAAIPGTSNHGWGIAADFASGVNVDSSAAHRWMEQNAGRFGWVNPEWARNSNPNDGQYEPWHWEFDEDRDRSKKAKRVRVELRKGEIGYGDKGPKVRQIQEDLNRHLQPQNRIKVDGDYGFATAVAVVKYQSSRRFSSVNGVAGPITRARLAVGRKK